MDQKPTLGQNFPNLTMNITFTMKSPNQTKKWDKAEVKDLTDYHTVKEGTLQNYINIWLRFLIWNRFTGAHLFKTPIKVNH